LATIAAIIAPTSNSTKSAHMNNSARNTASPVLPVGDRARRQFHARTRAP
jgi:hypothetical protein